MPDASAKVSELRRRWARIEDLDKVKNLLSWDMNVYMPPGGAEGRGRQLATVQLLHQEHLVDPAFADLVAELEGAGLEPERPEAAMVREARRRLDHASRVPAELVGELAEHASRARTAWIKARQDDDFALFAPQLERMLELKRAEAEAVGYLHHPFDALHEQFEPDSTAAGLKRIFEPMRAELVTLLSAIKATGITPADGFLRLEFDEAAQQRFGVEIAKAFGYEFERGRLDRTVHPFAIAVNQGDVRITTRYAKDFLGMAMFGTFHEAGHAIYEQGVSPEYDRTPLSEGVSLGMHESQSRMYENLVGRSRPFWEWAYPRLQGSFPGQLGGVGLGRFYAAVNRVQPSLIRVEADEVTYNLHILVRFELELALLEGDLAVRDLPAAWNDRFRDYLGITPPNDRLGCLQDVHWSSGGFGYFPTYALGNLIGAQLFAAASQANPGLEDDFRAGRFERLLAWLREHVHRHGRRYPPTELLRRATGKELDSSYFLNHLRTKFSGLYAL